MQTIIFIGFLSAFLTHFLNYCIGKPGSENFSPFEIFSVYTFWLSKRRLNQFGLYDKYQKEYDDNLKRVTGDDQLMDLDRGFREIVYKAAEPYFTWEKAAGMCPICFGFWVSLFSGLVFTQNLIELCGIVVLSHVVIRLLSKVI